MPRRAQICYFPSSADGLVAFGIERVAAGARGEGLTWQRRALALQRDVSGLWANVAALALDQGRTVEAARCARVGLSLNPTEPVAWLTLGQNRSEGRPATEEVAVWCRIVDIGVDNPWLLTACSHELDALARPAMALRALRRAVGQEPASATAWRRLGDRAYRQSEHLVSFTCFRRCRATGAGDVGLLTNSAAAANAVGRFRYACRDVRVAICLAPANQGAWSNLGQAQGGTFDLYGALSSAERAANIDPLDGIGWSNRAVVLDRLGRYERALVSNRRSLALNPQSAGDLANHGSYLKHSGEPLDAARWLRRALATRPGAADVHSALVYCLNYDAALDAAGLLAAAKLWNRRHARLAHPSTRLRGRRGVLRLGFVSGDFRRHPVGYFLSPFLRSLDRFRYQAVCYSNENFRDSVTDDIRSGATGWRQIHGQTDDAVEAQIHRDEIDVLVDLSGHTARNRLTLFTRRAAPVQLAWMGYFGTTGLTAIDAIVVDKIIAPPSSAIHYSEDLLHLPDCYICYAPPSAAPIAETTIDDDNRPATFGCFNDLGKISPLTLRMWSQIMAATPGSTLILKSAILDDENARRRWRLRLDAARIPVDRVSLEGWSPYDAYLRRYAAVDIALDPTPFSGGLTTLESLWMGVPAITLLGDRFAGRQSASYLTAIGRHELIARAPEEYIRLSVELAADASRRRNLRAHLRDDMLASVLCQPGRFTRQFEAALDRYMATNVGRKADADRPYRRK